MVHELEGRHGLLGEETWRLKNKKKYIRNSGTKQSNKNKTKIDSGRKQEVKQEKGLNVSCLSSKYASLEVRS